jgi:ketosteroid isomerase-like protein
MSDNANVKVVDCMTEAALTGDTEALAKVFTEDVELHVRGALPLAGDHVGAESFVALVSAIVARTKGSIDLEQKFCIGDGSWAAEWEHAKLGVDGKTYETTNSFIYRFDEGRIAEMWFINTEPAGSPLYSLLG